MVTKFMSAQNTQTTHHNKSSIWRVDAISKSNFIRHVCDPVGK